MVKVGIVGAGTMGIRHADILSSKLVSSRAKLVGVCDTILERAEELSDTYTVNAYDAIEQLIEREQPDVLYIAVPDDLHRDPVIKAAEYGVHVLVEKPLATTVEDALAIAEAVESAGIIAEVNFSNRWNPPFVAAQTAIEAGQIGEVVTLNSRLSNRISSPTQRLAWAASTTAGWFLLSHTIDLATWFTKKKAVSVYANGVKRKLADLGLPTYDYIHAIVKYEDGTDAMFETVWILPETTPSPIDFKYQIIGSDGAIQINTQDQMIQLSGKEQHEYPFTIQWAIPRLHAFLDVLEGGPAGATIHDGVENTRILVALHKSLETGATIKL